MPIYPGTITTKTRTHSIEVLNDFENFSFQVDQFKFIGISLDGFELQNHEKFSVQDLSIFDLHQGNYQNGEEYLELKNYVLTLKIPQTLIEVSTKKEIEISMDFQLELKENFEEAMLSFQLKGQHFEAKNGFLEIILDQLQKQFVGKYRFKNCYGCIYGDYSVYGQGFIGSMLCFKNQKEAYLNVQNKDEYMQLDLHDDQQQEIYCCETYEMRDKIVGYRGTVL